MQRSFATVGKRPWRADALQKLLGTAKYTPDIEVPGLLHAAVLRPIHPHAKIISIDTSRAERLPGVVCVLTAKDVPGANSVGAVLGDQPMLASDRVRHLGDGVALVAAELAGTARDALELIEVEYEKLPAITDAREARKPSSPLVHPDGRYGNERNVMASRYYEKGDPERGFDSSAVVLENEYRTPYQEHAFLETEAALAIPEPDGGVTVYGSMQCPFYVRTALARSLALPLAKIRIVQAVTGGAFGGKEDTPNEISARAALLALRTGRPVLKRRTREESIVIHTKRHPFWVRHMLGAKKDGTLLAADIEIVGDQGAYASVGPYVLFRAAMHAPGPYRIPNVRVEASFVYTNNVLTGAFRGFGQPQTTFASEAQMDAMARELGMDPLELREKNLPRPGELSHTGHVYDHAFVDGLVKVLDRGRSSSKWKDARASCDDFNSSNSERKRGIGASLVAYGVSLGREAVDSATSVVQVMEDGSVTVAHGGTEMGQGSSTALAMIAAEELGLPLPWVKVLQTDTSRVQNSGPSVASRVTSVIGESVRLAASEVRKTIAQEAGRVLGTKRLALERSRRGPVFKSANGKKASFAEVVASCYKNKRCLVGVGHRNVDLSGEPRRDYYTYSPALHIAEVEVDVRTGFTDVKKITAVNDVGRAIHPTMVEGQMQGGAVQGMGLAVMEELVTDDGRILNPNFTDYLIPTSMDAPEIVPVIVETDDPEGPFGAKGIGEPSLIPTPAAVANAISHALGKQVRELPATPERVFFLARED